MSTILTAAGESLIASLQAQGKGLVIDTMILALIPDQDHTLAIEPGVNVPDEGLIALRYAIPPEYRAYVNPNQVVYSAMLGSDMGDFSFNWQGLYCSEHDTLVAVATFPALEKRKYDEAASKTGNNLTRNFLLTFTGARELTGLTISADVWQLDFTVRLNGIDERERLSNYDIYGQGYFEGDGWLLQQTAEAYAFAPGLGYVGGIRAYLSETLPLAAPEAASLPQNVWLDVCLKPSGSDRVAEASPMLAAVGTTLADSAADETGLIHYRALVARIEADATVTDLRQKRLAIQPESVGAVPVTRRITTGAGLAGGGTLAGDLTLTAELLWNAGKNYDAPSLVLGADGGIYLWLAASGPDLAAGPREPGTADGLAYWAPFAAAASETIRGVIELATNAEAAALTDAERALTPGTMGSLFARSRYGHGYQALPGGMMIQWGSYTSGVSSSGVVCSFPIAFPCICFAILCSDMGNSCVTYAAYPLSASQFTLWGKLSGAYYVGSCFVIAIGC